MRLMIVTDAWLPQVNGVTTTLGQLAAHLGAAGHEVGRISPEQFASLPCPTYPEIRLACARPAEVARRLDAFAPDAVHIATEGPLGVMARRHCLCRGMPFTTSYHTRFPDYIAMRFGVPAAATWAVQRWFHNAGAAMMVAASSLREELSARGFTTVVPWSRGSTPRCSARGASRPSTCRGRCFSPSGAWRRRRISTLFSASTCREAG